MPDQAARIHMALTSGSLPELGARLRVRADQLRAAAAEQDAGPLRATLRVRVVCLEDLAAELMEYGELLDRRAAEYSRRNRLLPGAGTAAGAVPPNGVHRA